MSEINRVSIDGKIVAGGPEPVFIAGPCVIESEAHALKIAEHLAGIASEKKLQLIFKASFDKANRTSIDSFRGPGIKEGLRILSVIRSKTGLPVLTDIHVPSQAEEAAEVVDILQIPAFLCRQTDLLIAAARTGKVINVKKGQFVSPHDMKHVVGKLTRSGADKILLTERGSSFGYNNLVVDMRSISIMRSFGFPVIFDATHSVQLPGGGNGKSSGQREFVAPLAKAAAAAGADGFFFEIHDDPDNALSDGPNSLPLGDFAAVVASVERIHKAAEVKS